MADTTIPMKFTGNGSDLERALTELEKKYTDLEAKIVNAKTAAKTAAQQAKEDLKAQEKAEAEAARKQRELDRQAKAEAREERRKKEREESQARRKTEREEAEAKREQSRAERQAARDAVNAQRQAKREQIRAKKAAAAESKQLAHEDADESRRVLRRYTTEVKQAEREQARAERDAANEKKRLDRDAANEAKRLAREAANVKRQAERDALREKREAANEAKRIERERAREEIRIKKQEEREKKKIEREEKRAQEKLRTWVVGVGSVAAGYFGISSVLGTIINQHDELVRKADEFGTELDANARKFRVQAGLNALQNEAAQRELQEMAVKNAVKTESAVGAATQLVSGGFDANTAKDAAEIVLQTMAATGDPQGDASEFARAMTQATAAFGLEKTPKNLKRVGLMMSGSYKKGDFQAADMEQLAPKSQGLIAMGMSPEDIMAMYNIMRSVTKADTASTALKGFAEAHTAAIPLPGAKESRQEKLLKLLKVTDPKTGKKRSLTSAEVDLRGEDFTKVQPLMREGLENLGDKSVQNRFLQDFYGKEYAAAVQGLYARGSQFQGLRDSQFDAKQFAEDVKVSQSGKAALAVRTSELEKQQFASMETDEEAIFKAAERFARKRGESEAMIWANSWMAHRARAMGSTVENAASFILPDGEDVFSVLKEVQALKGNEPLKGLLPEWSDLLKQTMEKNNELLAKNNELLARQQPEKADNQPNRRAKPVNANE